MSSAWTDLSLPEIQQVCSSGRRIADGALNITYAGRAHGRHLFVRHRMVDDSGYGQTFVGERYVRPLLSGRVQIPHVLQVVPDATGTERYGVFEFIEGRTPDWTDTGNLYALADMLAEIHAVSGPGYGNITDELRPASSETYIGGLLADEYDRLSAPADKQFLDAAQRCAYAATEFFRGEACCLCHGDVHSGNILYDKAGKVWLVDWEAARYRVAAADFNQLHIGWLSPEQQEVVVRRYVSRTARDSLVFRRQIHVLRYLWHLRTYNFHTLVRQESPNAHAHHLVSAVRLAGDLRDRGLIARSGR